MDKRSDARQILGDPENRYVEFSVIDNTFIPDLAPREVIRGSLLDISGNGLGFATDVPMEPGNLLEFKNLDQGNSGVVMWTIQLEKKYRVGVRFIKK